MYLQSSLLAPWQHGFTTRHTTYFPDPLYMCEQVHSSLVWEVEGSEPNPVGQGDALITRTPGMAIGVKTADCVPILLAHTGYPLVACIHAGWRGAVHGVIKRTLERIPQPEELRACIGPCIFQASYEVGDALREAVPEARFFAGAHFDLPGYVEEKLRTLGVQHIERIPLDTFREENLLWSYRRDPQNPGRQIAWIRLSMA